MSTLKRNAVFILISVAAGLALAWLAVRLFPGLLHAPVAQPVAGMASPAPRSTAPQRPAEKPAATEDPALAGSPLLRESGPQGSFSAAVRAAAPAVVSVYTQRTERTPASVFDPLFGPQRPRVQQGLGSGVIVDAQGHIITNHHVIAESDKVRVQLSDGREADATVVGSDPDTDIAVLQIRLPKMPVMTLGRSDRVQVGDVVLAIGTPLGLSQTVTHGIVSALGRAQLGVAAYENFIQTDAAINFGNSGGALVDFRGELIGINTAVLGKNLGAEGIGVAIPVDLVRGVMQEIVKHGRVIRGWVGIVTVDVGAEDAARAGLAHPGVAIANLYRDSPAVEVGLARRDLIEAVNGTPVRSAQDALARIASHKPGSTVKLTGIRGTRRFSVDVRVIEAPAQAAQ
ncbi:MAG TPA: trypsin-like peptidase domain-containing protein [Steroidobacteraceae bacterium]|nr:trypsin-like peptidase domain-containing protein [Steroidobacteraceae bacterium]